MIINDIKAKDKSFQKTNTKPVGSSFKKVVVAKEVVIKKKMERCYQKGRLSPIIRY